MNYRRPDTGSMYRDALRRTREMQRQNADKNDVQADIPCDVPPEPEKGAVESGSVVSKGKKNNGLFSGFFTDGRLDSDKIIIIALIVILAKEGADIKLLLALGYILM